MDMCGKYGSVENVETGRKLVMHMMDHTCSSRGDLSLAHSLIFYLLGGFSTS
ncbi:BnaA06g09300D [Brassica napus]|uniref:BnaA06g09300D protein n=2 Tax=Brassica TaxID=3705 RepID=A0A078I314_BRANA|nr:BnaA06g09300D [Brassica napus]VDC65690.1 unnamed protein product [Brassica rapa]